NREHLAVIEVLVGSIPSRMARKSRCSKYFYKDKFDWGLIDPDLQRKFYKLKMIRDYFDLDSTIQYNLYRCIKKMLEIYPKYRHSAKYFLNNYLIEEN
ncbi:MAG: Dual specificity protein kinase clk2, partial [Paramarteilia canceri]